MVKLDDFDRWKPIRAKSKWLLLAGATDPPESVHITDRRSRDGHSDRSGSFLHGVSRDLANVEATMTKIKGDLFNSVRDFYLTKEDAVCNCIVSALGISLGLRRYFIVYPDSSHNTVILNYL